MRRFSGAGVLAACVALLGAPVATAAHGPSLSWSPTTSVGAYDFGDVLYPQDTPPGQAGQTFILTNAGSRIGKLRVSLTGDPDFTIGTDTCSGTALRKGASCSVWVAFEGMAGGSAMLTVTGNHPAASVSLTVTVDSVTELITNPPPPPGV